MSDRDADDGVITITTPGNYIVQIDGQVIEVKDENFMPVIWDGEDWVLDRDSFSDEDAYDRAMSIL